MADKDKPEPMLDLDALEEIEVDASGKAERYSVMAKGVRVHFEDPNDLPWQEAEDLNKFVQSGELTQALFILIKDDDELDAFFEGNYRAKTLEKVLNSYYKHHGYDPLRGRMNRADRRARTRAS